MLRPDAAKPWIHALNPNAQVRLFCLPYAGGGTLDYRTWQENVPSSIDVCPIALPGRGHRMSEAAYSNLRLLAQDLVTELKPVFRQAPFAIFGHSMGAWIAYEIARELRRQRLDAPEHLFLSARWSPDLPTATPKLSHLPDDQFVNAVQHRYNAIPQQLLDQPTILKMFLPSMRADFALLDTYVYSEEAPLDVPITAYRGMADKVVPLAGVQGWKVHTTAAFKMRQYAGGHFFLKDSAELLCDSIAAALR
jgi:medium-chain acyl-[acyl-carrier-protein] hydrolase